MNPTVVVDPRTNIATPTGYSSNFVDGEDWATTVAAQLTYATPLAISPIRSETMSILLKDGGGNVIAQGKDLGNDGSGTGQIWGVGLSGTIVYATGVLTINLAADPGNGKHIFVSYQQNYELSSDLPKIDSFFASAPIMARIYALKGNIGMLQSFGMRKRFGMTAEDELAKDLVQEINRELGGEMIRKLAAAAITTTTYSDTPPNPAISVFEHKLTCAA